MLAEHIKKMAGTPEWYNYDFSIAVSYLKFICTTEKQYNHLLSRFEELEAIELPEQAVVQDIMARL